MNRSESRSASRPPVNPFPPAAVARVSDREADLVTIETPAIQRLREQVDTYLNAGSSGVDHDDPGAALADTGAAIVIAGDYGSGKTHMAMDVLDHVTRDPRTQTGGIRALYQVAPGGSFLSLYVELMGHRIRRSDVIEQVREFYSDIVAEDLRLRAVPESVIADARDADPVVVVERLGLRENVLLDELRTRLRRVTTDEAFSRALALLLRPAFENAAWQWLCGAPPEGVLVERGVNRRIDTDKSGLEALGVIALLHGRRGRRFVLIVDELEKMILTQEQPSPGVAQAFKQLLEVFRNAGALLVLCGLEDIYKLLPKDTDRTTPPVVPSALTSEQVEWYITQTHSKAFGEPVLDPFDADTVDFLVQLAGGSPRQVVKLCFSTYERFLESPNGRGITNDMIQEAAYAQFSLGTADEVREEVDKLLVRGGWPRAQTLSIEGIEGVARPKDFWVALGQPDDPVSGVAVLVSEVLLTPGQVEELVEIGTAIRADQRREAILVLCGYVPDDFRDKLAEAFSGWPLIYDRLSFSRAFRDEMLRLTGPRRRPRQADPAEPRADAALVRVTEELDRLLTETVWLRRQQFETHDAIENLADQVTGFVDDSTSRLRQIEARDEGARTQVDTARALPPGLQRHFDTASERLASFSRVDELCHQTLLPTQSGASLASPGALRRLRIGDDFASIGVSELLADLLSAFRNGVAQWLQTAGSTQGGPGETEQQRLRTMCTAFDSVYSAVPLTHLDGLLALSAAAGAPDRLGRSRAARRDELRDSLSALSDLVYQDAVDAVSR